MAAAGWLLTSWRFRRRNQAEMAAVATEVVIPAESMQETMNLNLTATANFLRFLDSKIQLAYDF